MESGWGMNMYFYGSECSADGFLTAWRGWPWKSFLSFQQQPRLSFSVSFVIWLPAFRIISHVICLLSHSLFQFLFSVLFTCINLHLFSDWPDGMLPLWIFNNTFAKCHVDPFAPCLGEFRCAPPVHLALRSSISEFDLAYNEDSSFILDAEPAVQLPLSRLSFVR